MALLRRPKRPRLFFWLDQPSGRRQSCMQVECRTGDENVQPQPEHADRLAFAHLADGREADIRRVHDGHAAAALHLEGFVRTDKGGRVLIETDADGEGMMSERRDEATQAVSLAERLV